VQITGWNDNDGNEYIPTANNNFGKQNWRTVA
jgi:hypothetical protein